MFMFEVIFGFVDVLRCLVLEFYCLLIFIYVLVLSVFEVNGLDGWKIGECCEIEIVLYNWGFVIWLLVLVGLGGVVVEVKLLSEGDQDFCVGEFWLFLLCVVWLGESCLLCLCLCKLL